MTIAVIYTRVSSRAQVNKGDGLASQESRCRDYAAYKGHDVAATFQDAGVSGGIADRPGIKEMLKWLRQNRSREPVVIIDDISRIARGVEAHWTLRNAIGSVGGRLESPSIEFGEDSDSQLIENMLASVSQHHRQKNGEQPVHRMAARMRNGYFAFWAPTGYKYVASKGEGKVLARAEPEASLIQEALEGFASGRFQSQAEVKRFLEPHPIFGRDRNGQIHPQRIKNLLTNKIYAGHYEYKPWGIGLTKGRHPALIDWKTFQRIQERMGEKSYVVARADVADDFPLRGFVTCACCSHPMTGYWAKGRTKRYAYYECFQKGCPERRKSIRRDEVESAFATLLGQLRPNMEMMQLAAQIFRDIWSTRTGRIAEQRKAQKQAMAALDGKIAKLTDRLIETDSPATVRAYEAKLEKLEAERAVIAEDIAKPAPTRQSFDQSFRTAMTFLANPRKLWDSPSLNDRRTVLKLVFASPLPYARNRGFRTAKTTIPFKVLGGNHDDEVEMAGRQGFEPWGRSHAQRFSRPSLSTTQTPHRASPKYSRIDRWCQ